MNKCKCGCDGVPKTPGCCFLPGHNTRVQNPMSNPVVVKKVTESYMKAIKEYAERN